MKMKVKFTKILLALVLALSFIVPFDRAIGADESVQLEFPNVYTIILKNKEDIYTKYKVIVKDGETNIYEETREITNEKIEIDFKSDSIIGTATKASAEFYLLTQDENVDNIHLIHKVENVVTKPIEYYEYDATNATVNKVDGEVPIITEAKAGNPTADNTVVISVVASDNYTGALMYKFDEKNGTEGTWQDSANFTVSKNGVYVVTVKDASDNVSAPTEVNVTTIPNTLTSVSQTSIAVSNDKKVTYTYAIDASQGEAPIEYKIKKADNSYLEPVTINSGVESITVEVPYSEVNNYKEVVFSNGNSGEKIFTLETSNYILEQNNVDITLDKTSTESINVTNNCIKDTTDDLKENIQLSLDNANYASSINITENGLHTIYIKTKYGQVLEYTLNVNTIDKAAPTIEEVTVIDAESFVKTRQVDFTVSDTDFVVGTDYELTYKVSKKTGTAPNETWEDVADKTGTINLNTSSKLSLYFDTQGTYRLTVLDKLSLVDESKHVTNSNDFEITKLDNEGPSDFKVQVVNANGTTDNVTSAEITKFISDVVTETMKFFNSQFVKVVDVVDEGAQIDNNKYYQIVEKNENGTNPSEDENAWKGEEDLFTLTSGKQYVVFVRDKLGNLSQRNFVYYFDTMGPKIQVELEPKTENTKVRQLKITVIDEAKVGEHSVGIGNNGATPVVEVFDIDNKKINVTYDANANKYVCDLDNVSTYTIKAYDSLGNVTEKLVDEEFIDSLSPELEISEAIINGNETINTVSDGIYSNNQISYNLIATDDQLKSVKVGNGEVDLLEYIIPNNNGDVGELDFIITAKVEENSKVKLCLNVNNTDVDEVEIPNDKIVDGLYDISDLKITVSDKVGNSDTVKFVGVNDNKELVLVDEGETHISAKLDLASANIEVKDIYTNGTEISNFNDTIYANELISYGIEVSDNNKLSSVTVQVNEDEDMSFTYSTGSVSDKIRLVAKKDNEGIKVSLVKDGSFETIKDKDGNLLESNLANAKVLELSKIAITVTDEAGNNITRFVGKEVSDGKTKLATVLSLNDENTLNAKLDIAATVIIANEIKVKNKADIATKVITDYTKDICANDIISFGLSASDDTLDEISVLVNDEEANKLVVDASEYIKANSSNNPFEFSLIACNNNGKINLKIVDKDDKEIVKKEIADKAVLDLSKIAITVTDKAGNKVTRFIGKEISDDKTKLTVVENQSDNNKINAKLDLISPEIVANDVYVDNKKIDDFKNTLYAKDKVSYGIGVTDNTLGTIKIVVNEKELVYNPESTNEQIRLIVEKSIEKNGFIKISLVQNNTNNLIKDIDLECTYLDISNIKIIASDKAGNTITKYIGKNANNELVVVDENGSRVKVKLDIKAPSVALSFIHSIGSFIEAEINEIFNLITGLTTTDKEPNQDNKIIDNTNVKVLKKFIVTSTKQLEKNGLEFNYSIDDNAELDRAFVKVYDNDKLLDGKEYGIEVTKDGILKLAYDKTNGYNLKANSERINIPVDENNQLTFHINAMDKSGNYGTQMICRVYIDDKAPVIESVYPITNIKSDNLQSLIDDSKEWFYQAFNNDEIVICVKVNDIQNGKLQNYPIGDGDKSIESVQYALYEDKDVDSRGNIIKDLDWKYVDKSTVSVPTNNLAVGNYKFVIPNNGKEEFLKTRIAIRVTDIYGNISDNTYTCGIIIQKAPDHTISDLPITKINLDKAKYTGNIGNRKNVNLYANDIKPVLEVTEKAGIENFYWSLDNYEVKNETNFDETRFDNKDKHLRLYAKKTITVKEGNDQKITFIVTDKTGNETKIKKTVSVDKTAPKAIVSFSGDKTANNYYKQDREAVITITDANIDQNILNAGCVLKYTENGVEKTKKINNFVGSDKEYSATVRFSENADFKITGIHVTDYAGNVCEKVNDTEKFTIDKIKPTVSVSYSGSAVNGNYFAAARSATITVNEHNFDASKMNIAITSSDNGQPFSVSNSLSWSNNGDTHVATYTFGQDGKYQFVFNGEDKAGNRLETYQSPEFYVDLSDPTVDINIPNNSAHADEIAPVITIKDTNLDLNASTYQITTSKNRKFDLVPNITDSGTQKVISFANFPKKMEYDEIYQLSVNGIDKAGRRVNKVVNFSVNRFGSTYKIVTDLSKPFDAPTEIVIEETNVSPISDVVIRVNHDSLTTDLKAGKDYTITKLGGAWNRNCYTIKSDVFNQDGEYIITISSKDAVGHDNYSGQKSKKTSVKVTVDTTEPIIKAIGVESNAVYNEPGKEIKFSIFDNVGVKDFEILVNGQKLSKDQYVYDEETGEVTLKLAESSSAQKVEVVLTDVAGNKSTLSVDNVLVTTNAFVRLYSNKPLFIGLIFLILAILFFIFFILLKKKKKNEEEATA